MKIMITGKNGYVANKLAKYLKEKPLVQKVEKINLRNGVENLSFDMFDVCVHCAALVHKKENNFQESDYFYVNTDLTIKLAKKAKEHGVGHFIFLSTMAVYGKENGEISKTTPMQPQTFYGKSKLAAEQALLELSADDFVISIIRPPMIYGPDCPGNYALLRKMAKKTPIFPLVDNKRSMLYIDHLTEFMWQLICSKDSGSFHPQDSWYMNTSQLVQAIAVENQHRLVLNKTIGKLLVAMFAHQTIVNKVFGNLTYSKELSIYKDNSYQMYSLNEAISRIEGRGNK